MLLWESSTFWSNESLSLCFSNAEMLPNQIKAAYEVNSDSDPEIRYRRHDGSVFWASLFVSPVRDDNGDACSILHPSSISPEIAANKSASGLF